MQTIQEIQEEFFEDCQARNFAQRTIESYRSSLKPWEKYLSLNGIKHFGDLTKQNLLGYRNYLQTTHRSPKGKVLSMATQMQKISTLRSFLRFAHETGNTLLTPENLPKVKRVQSLPKGILSKQKVRKLLQLPPDTLLGKRDRTILELFYSTGIRRKELLGIQLEDCQLKEKKLFIRDGKGNKQRWVPLGKEVCKILRDYISNIRPKLIGNKQHNYLIVANKGGKVYGPKVYKIVKKYLNMLGIDSHCHGLRHTTATHLLKGNVNLRVIQSVLGHESLSSTQIYTRVEIEDMVKAVAKAHPREQMELDDD